MNQDQGWNQSWSWLGWKCFFEEKAYYVAASLAWLWWSGYK